MNKIHIAFWTKYNPFYFISFLILMLKQLYSEGLFLVNPILCFYLGAILSLFIFLRLIFIDTLFDYRKILRALYIHCINFHRYFWFTEATMKIFLDYFCFLSVNYYSIYLFLTALWKLFFFYEFLLSLAYSQFAKSSKVLIIAYQDLH